MFKKIIILLFVSHLLNGLVFAQDQGKLFVTPLLMRAGSLQDIKYKFVVGKNGIKKGGGIVILPWIDLLLISAYVSALNA